MPVRVLLVDDVVEVRAVVRQRLQLRGGFDVVAEAVDGAGAIVAAGEHQPDLVVLDLGLPDLAGHEVLTGLRAAAPRAQVVVYTGSVSRERFALSRDVDAYVGKDRDVTYLVELLVEVTGRGRQAATLALEPNPSDVALARRSLIAHCQRWDCDHLVEDGQLIVSELVTNAFVHSASRCELRFAYANGVLRIEASDGGEGAPDPRAAGLHDENGRGLLIVSALADAWGVEPLPAGGKVVWAELRSPVRPGTGRSGTGADDTVRRADHPAGSSTPEAGQPVPRPGGYAVVLARLRGCSRALVPGVVAADPQQKRGPAVLAMPPPSLLFPSRDGGI